MEGRRGIAGLWASRNPVLLSGEIGFESDTGLFKIGDGATAWNDLPYAQQARHVRTITSSGPVLATDDVLICDASTMTATLPAATGSGRQHTIKNVNASPMTLAITSGDTLDGDAGKPVSTLQAYTVVDAEAGKWLVIGGYEVGV
jgi:hypothetical protein